MTPENNDAPLTPEEQNDLQDASREGAGLPPATELAAEPSEAEATLARMVDPEQLAKVRETLKRFKETKAAVAATPPPADPTAPAPPKQGPPSGKDVDWSEYDLQYDIKHLYPMAQFRETPQGPKWVVMVDEFFSTEKMWRGHGKKNNRPNALDKTETEASNLGEYLGDMLNGPEGWQVTSLLPGSTGMVGVLLRRPVPVVLPDPKLLQKETEVVPPSDPELQRVEEAALAFAAEEGLAPPVPEESLEAKALGMNAPTEYDPGAGMISAERAEKLDAITEQIVEDVKTVREGEDFERKVDETGRVDG